MKIIDVNAGFGFWPIQRFSSHRLEELDEVFQRTDVDEVWLSAVESILFPEPDSWDTRLFAQLDAYPRFRPVKTANPTLANWRSSWDEAAAAFPLAAIKLFPNYHGYSLSDVRLADLCRKAALAKLPVLITVRVNDERNQPHFLQVAGVSVNEIASLSLRHPDTIFVALCAYTAELPALSMGGNNLLVDISFLDGMRLLEHAASILTEDRIVYGSHEAFLHAQAAHLKFAGSRLPTAAMQKIAEGNISARLSH